MLADIANMPYLDIEFEKVQKRMVCSSEVFGRGEDPEEAQVACVFCGAAGPASTLDCLHCQSTIPFCLATGKSNAMLLYI